MINIKKLLTIILILSLILIISCKEKEEEKAVLTVEPEIETVTEEVQVIEPEETACSSNKDCTDGKLCINNKCGKLEDYYASDCSETCKIATVSFTTSDEEEYTLNSGEGSYSYAGALEFKIVNTPLYCKGNEPLIPIKLIKKNTGQILGEELITLKKGEVSRLITHPTIARVEFTITIDDVTEECS